jgi:hypothetical protein
MPLDGLRAWIGEVERKLGMRTRVFLVLAVIAIGGAGAAIYLAVDARESSVSEADVQALQEKLEARIGEGGGEGGGAAQLQSELRALQAQVEQLSGESGASGQSEGKKGGSGGSEAGGGNGSGGASSEGSGGGATEGTSGGATGGGASRARLKGLLEQAEKQNEQAESEQGHH